jgi:hypothetical protein
VGQFDRVESPHWQIVDFTHIFPGMTNLRNRVPMVEVTAPDGSKSLWVAAVAKANAVAAVKQVIPTNYVAALSQRRLTLTRKSQVLRRGDVRRVLL